jgi:ATP-dependent exoDNAse (exonuclease V) beta subunit
MDFKTDELRNRQALTVAQEMYTPQILRYRLAVELWLGIAPKSMLCFLNVEKTIEMFEVK